MLLPISPVGLEGYKMDNKSEKEKLSKSLIDGYVKAFPKHSKNKGIRGVKNMMRNEKDWWSC